MMDSKRLQVFSALYKTRSFSRAAQMLKLSQSTVSEHLKRLEQSLGQLLFERHSRKVEPTAKALALWPHAEKILEEMELAARSLRDNPPSGILHISAGETLAAYWLPPLLARFQVSFPQAQVRLKEGLKDPDINFRLRPALNSGRALVELCLVAKKRTKANRPLWLPDPEADIGATAQAALKEHKVAGYLPNQASLLRVAVQGSNISLVSMLAARPWLDNRELALLGKLPYRLELDIQSNNTALSRAFLDFVQEY